MPDQDLLKLDLTCKTRPVELVQPDGTSKMYELRVISGKQRSKYMTKLVTQSNVNADGSLMPKDFDGLFTEMICASMFDSNGIAVKSEEAESFPGPIQQTLFQAAMELNGMDKEAIEEAKNS